MSATIWVPTSTIRKGQPDVADSPELVDRKVKGLLTTLTMENFESNSDQATRCANNGIEAKREEETARKRTTENERARKEGEENERTRKAEKKKKQKEKTKKEENHLRIKERAHIAQTVSEPGEVPEPSTKRDDSVPHASALLTARVIENLNEVVYPEGIKSPKVELNVNVRDGRFIYDRDFLLQFMHICKLKPPTLLPTLGVLGIERVDKPTSAMPRGGRHRNASAMPVSANRQASVDMNIDGFQKPSVPNGSQMGNFRSPGTNLTSEEHFALTSNVCSASTNAATVLQFCSPIASAPSLGGPDHPTATNPTCGKRTRTKRGEKHGVANKATISQRGHGSGFGSSGVAPVLGTGSEPVASAPLELSANRWVPATGTTRKVQPDVDSPELVFRKVKALLNKLTIERFDLISDDIIHWANKSENEKDGRTLIQVIRVVFEHAMDEPAWSEMYARLCRKMMDQISPDVQDEGIIAGGLLFQTYLLNRCKEDFERGWLAKEATAAVAAAKASDSQATKAAHAKKGTEKAELHFDEHYAAQKAKRQCFSLVKFICELFKLQMLTERIMHDCVKKLLGNVKDPEGEEIKSLCQLFKAVGQLLDTPTACAHMDVYFTHMKELGKSQNVNPRVQFMLQDIFELRDRRWVGRNVVAAPVTFAVVYEAAVYRQVRISRGGRRLGGEQDQEQGPDSWAVASGSVAQAPPKLGEVSLVA